MLWLDPFLRVASITLVMLGAVLAVRDRLCWRPTVFIIFASFGVTGTLLASSPASLNIPMPLLWLAYSFEAVSVVSIWWLGLALFRDDFKLQWPHWVVFALTFGLRFPHNVADITQSFNYPPLLAGLCQLMVLLMMGHLVFAILHEAQDDLVPKRRRTRNYFIIGLASSSILLTLASQGWFHIPLEYVQFLKAATVFPMALWFTLWLSHLDLQNLSFEAETPEIITTESIDPRDKPLLAQLLKTMEIDKAYREPGLTIRSLAETLNTPEHRLRSLINQGLGYRNFSAFLNNYRISALKVEFQDPSKSRTPILTLAMDVGYNSLAPFNKAFRELENMTPTAYRQKVLSDNEIV